ncbi:YaaA family protein [Micromonospora sp. NPDC003197]
MIILLHSSKTMRPSARGDLSLGTPALLDRARTLADYLKTLSPEQVTKVMAVSPDLAERTHALLADWGVDPQAQMPAVDAFVGDIYSGLHAGDLAPADRDYADRHLRILSGLYGILRPNDGIQPYRLEMGYRLPDPTYANLYRFWGDAIARCLPDSGLIVNLAAVEYSKTVTPFIDQSRLVTPKFLTVDPKTGAPKFVVVHAKIARGAFARWLLTSRVDTVQRIPEFAEIGYRFDAEASTPQQPVFVCQDFGGKGLSVRLSD